MLGAQKNVRKSLVPIRQKDGAWKKYSHLLNTHKNGKNFAFTYYFPLKYTFWVRDHKLSTIAHIPKLL